MAAALLFVLVTCICMGSGNAETQAYILVYPSTFVRLRSYFEILISTTAENAQVQVSGATFTETITIHKDTGYRYNLSAEDYHLGQYGDAERKAVLVQSDEEIAVQGHIEGYGTSGYMVAPVSEENNRFILPMLTYNQNVIIAAKNDNTRVTLRYHNGYSSTVSLPSFGTFTIIEQVYIHGIIVTATAPIALYLGHVCPGMANCDRMIENIPPMTYSGLRYIVPPIGNKGRTPGGFIRMLFTNETGNAGAIFGVWEPFKNEGFAFNCTSYCFIYQYNRARDGGASSVDRIMMRVLPISQHAARFMWMTPRRTSRLTRDVCKHYVSIIAPTEDTNGVALDGRVVNLSSWSVITESLYSWASLRVGEGCHYVEHIQGSKLAAYAYGGTTRGSYAFPAASGFIPNRTRWVVDPNTDPSNNTVPVSPDGPDGNNQTERFKFCIAEDLRTALISVSAVAGVLLLALIVTLTTCCVMMRIKTSTDDPEKETYLVKEPQTQRQIPAEDMRESAYVTIMEKESSMYDDTALVNRQKESSMYDDTSLVNRQKESSMYDDTALEHRQKESTMYDDTVTETERLQQTDQCSDDRRKAPGGPVVYSFGESEGNLADTSAALEQQIGRTERSGYEALMRTTEGTETEPCRAGIQGKGNAPISGYEALRKNKGTRDHTFTKLEIDRSKINDRPAEVEGTAGSAYEALREKETTSALTEKKIKESAYTKLNRACAVEF